MGEMKETPPTVNRSDLMSPKNTMRKYNEDEKGSAS